jgi:hypothetical protein
MKQKEVVKKIGGIIQELSDQYEYLQTVTGDLNDLELELFVSNAHFLTDHIEILCKLNLQNDKAKKTPVERQETVAYEQKYFEPVVQQMKHATEEKPAKEPVKPVEKETPKKEKQEDLPAPEINLVAEAPEDNYALVPEEPETIRHELVIDEAMDLDDDEENAPEIDASKGTKKRKTAAAEAASEVAETEEAKPADDKDKAETPPKATDDDILTINEKISSQLGDKALSKTEQLSLKPISDIKLAITLNDKLLYVKDLFNGYNLAYSEAIEILNRFNSFEEAMRFLKTNYITKNNWDSKPATTEKFYTLLKRRYA